MCPDKIIFTNSDPQTGGEHPSQSLITILDQELANVDDIYKNLLADYDETTYDKFERRFIEIRNKFKSILMDYSNKHWDYINRSEKRKEVVNQILKYATEVAQRFQEARENERLDRPRSTDAIENLQYSIKNLKHILENQGKL